jgi:zinc/manganese transport system substrate-binding protein
VNNIAKAFCAADATGCPDYQANAKAYDEKLQALDAELKASVAQIPAARRTIITSHDAFGYLGREYGFLFLAPQGISTESEASAADVAALIQQIKNQKAAALFLENVSNPRLIQQIANETGMKIGGELYSDALSTADGPAATYIDMMRHNVNTIRDAALGR